MPTLDKIGRGDTRDTTGLEDSARRVRRRLCVMGQVGLTYVDAVSDDADAGMDPIHLSRTAGPSVRQSVGKMLFHIGIHLVQGERMRRVSVSHVESLHGTIFLRNLHYHRL